MMRTIALGCALLGCVLLGGGCKTRVAPLKPTGTATIKLDDKQKISTFALRPRHLLVLTLPPAQPAQQWAISFHDTRYLKLMSEIQAPANPEEGARVSFLALIPGRTRLRFVLLPATNRRVIEPLDQQELVLTIQ